MGIDPTTHEPGLIVNKSSPSTRHMAQWESARLEAEARLSKQSSVPKTQDDFYLRLWNSEVGEDFRSFKKADVSSPKCCSLSGTTTEMGVESNKCWIKGGTDSCSSSNEDSSDDSTLQLLLDFPTSNDMSFLETDSYDSLYPGFLH